MILVDGVEIKTPSEMTWGLQDVSASSSGRTDDSIMHKERVSQKRKLSFSWSGVTPSEAASILQAFNPEYVNITYPDAMTGTNLTKVFYVGDRTSPYKIWTVKNKRYAQVSFDAIER